MICISTLCIIRTLPAIGHKNHSPTKTCPNLESQKTMSAHSIKTSSRASLKLFQWHTAEHAKSPHRLGSNLYTCMSSDSTATTSGPSCKNHRHSSCVHQIRYENKPCRFWRNKFIEKRKDALIKLYPAKQHKCHNGYHKTLETLFLLS
jgi:hypothetical protein